jgi:hypothetical protein
MAEGKSPVRAHELFAAKDAPRLVRVNLPDGTPRDIAIDDTEELAAHGIVMCPNCGAPNHAMQLADAEQPWIQCGCRGLRIEVPVTKKGREHLKATREAMIAAVNAGRGTVSRG